MLDKLRKIIQAVESIDDERQAINHLVSQTKLAMACQCSSLYLLTPDNSLQLAASDGLAHSAVGQTQLAIGEGLIGTVAQRQEPLNIADVRQDPNFKLLPEVKEDDLLSLLATPIFHRRILIGVIAVQDDKVRSFDNDEQSFLITLAAQLAWVLQQLDVFHQQHNSSHSHFYGTAVSAGIAIAPASLLELSNDFEVELKKGASKDHESRLLNQAVMECRTQFSRWRDDFNNQHNSAGAQIFDAYLSLLEPYSLVAQFEEQLEQGWQASAAIVRAVNQVAAQFEVMDDAYLKQRSNDVIDIGKRLLQHLYQDKRRLSAKEPLILVAAQASASILAEVIDLPIAGIVIQDGGIHSHLAILARSMDIPTVMGVNNIAQHIKEGDQLIVDGDKGELFINPVPLVAKAYQVQIATIENDNQKYLAALEQAPATIGDQPLGLLLNAGLTAVNPIIKKASVKGIGLYRSEIPFMLNQHYLSEEQQYHYYKKIVRSAAGKPVCIRTLDAGGDKPLGYFPINEDNPYLGWRGIRISLDHPELFLMQLRAILRAAASASKLQIMLPMVSSIEEISRAYQYLQQAKAELTAEFDLSYDNIEFGIMIEVPSMLWQLDQVLELVDFVSVGSNDLTQYILAVDRTNAAVSHLYQTYHPAVLRALADIASKVQSYPNKSLSICGEIAGEVPGALLLLAMGYRNLSMNPSSIAKVNYLVRKTNMDHWQNTLQQALTSASAEQVIELIGEQIKRSGLEESLTDFVKPN